MVRKRKIVGWSAGVVLGIVLLALVAILIRSPLPYSIVDIGARGPSRREDDPKRYHRGAAGNPPATGFRRGALTRDPAGRTRG